MHFFCPIDSMAGLLVLLRKPSTEDLDMTE